MRESKISIRIVLSTQLPAFFVACVVCMNAIRCYFPGFPNYTFYPIYILAFIFSIRFNRMRMSSRMRREVAVLFIMFAVLDLYALGTALTSVKESIGSYFEMTVTIGLCYAFFLMGDKAIRETVNWIIRISSVYALSLLLFPGIGERSNLNYLSITLPIGLGLSLLLTKVVLLILENSFFSRRTVLYLALIAIDYICLTHFAARGSVLFPIAVMAFVTLITSKYNIKKTILEVIVLVIFAAVGYRLFFSHASEYAIGRMLRMFQDTASETRWAVWRETIIYILDRKLYVFGCGTNGFVNKLGFYPHNLYLQLIGEFGILGLIISIYVTYLIIKYQVKLLFNSRLKRSTVCTHDDLLVFNVAGLLYFFLCFMKSSTVYDIYPMMAFYMWIVCMYDRHMRQVKKEM